MTTLVVVIHYFKVREEMELKCYFMLLSGVSVDE